MRYNIDDKLEFNTGAGNVLGFRVIEINTEKKTYKFMVEGEPGNGEIIEIEEDFTHKFFSRSLLLAKLSKKIEPNQYVRKYNIGDMIEINFEAGHRLVLRVMNVNEENNTITFISEGTPGGGNIIEIDKSFANYQFSQDLLLAKLSEEIQNKNNKDKQYSKKF